MWKDWCSWNKLHASKIHPWTDTFHLKAAEKNMTSRRKNILRRKKSKLQDNDFTYVLCDLKRKETSFHLFFNCPFSKRCWQQVNINWCYQVDFFLQHLSKLDRTMVLPSSWKSLSSLHGKFGSSGTNSSLREAPFFDRWKAGFIEGATLQANRLPIGKQTDFTTTVQQIF